MNRILRRAVLAAGSLGVAGGIALTALPASAAPSPPPIPPVAAWGADAFGPIHFPPVAFANSFHTPGVASNANFTNFLTTGLIIDRASFTTGYSAVDSPLVNLSFLQATIQADRATSWCHLAGRFPFGGASIFSGSVVWNGSTIFNPLTNPAPNTRVRFVKFFHHHRVVLGTVIFNRQERENRGRLLEVTAIYVQTGPEKLSIGVTRCGRPSRPMVGSAR